MSKDLVVKHNKIIESKYNMTTTEAKLIAKLTSTIQKEDKEFKDYKFRARNLLDELGLGENYTLLKNTIRKLITREIEIKEEGENIITTILSSCRYKKDSTIILRYDPVLKPYFLQLKNNFTKYYLENVLELNSFYSIRIYELVKQYQAIKNRKFELEELKEILKADQKSYQIYNNFKRKVLEQAKKEINNKTDIKIDYEQIKTGRKVTAIRFKILATKDTSKTNKANTGQSSYDEKELEEKFKLLIK